MSRRTSWLLALVAVTAMSACSPSQEGIHTTVARTNGAESALQAVEGVVAAVSDGTFDEAGTLAVKDQAALAALAEGASFTDVATALRESDPEVAANFWSGFAQGAGSYLAGTVSYFEGDSTTVDGVTFESIRVLPADGSERTLWVRTSEIYEVDLFASFGAGLADKMIGPVERLLSAQTDDSRYILGRLQAVVPSLSVASENAGVSTEARQQILALVELITRVS